MKLGIHIVIGISLLAGGCSHLQSTAVSQDHRKPIRVQQVQLDILPSPGMLKDEFNYPKYTSRQRFSWGQFGQQWSVKIFDDSFEYAGFQIRKPFALDHLVETTILRFKLRPATAAQEFAMAFVGGDGRMLTQEAPNLAAYQTNVDALGWATYDIHLSDFYAHLEAEENTAGAFDWDNVQQIRLVRTASTMNIPEIQIRNLRLRPSSFGILLTQAAP